MFEKIMLKAEVVDNTPVIGQVALFGVNDAVVIGSIPKGNASKSLTESS